ncbi:YitT family protein [Buttiauxella noackiae]|uniref:YitT family protein n=1 Tax=Buttiauxella noackiae TaxID=82992 RepID=UPI00235614C4|nr:YitT family protein [Buttiauxella noackiae]MCA1924388.1 YitT family protein [Buttiauxella noackiae]
MKKTKKINKPQNAPGDRPLSVRHNLIDNIQGQIFGVIIISFGMSILHGLGLITGQTAGLAFLITYATGTSFGIVFFLINIPFYLLAAMRLGFAFTINTLMAVTLISIFTGLLPSFISYNYFNPLVGSVLAGLCIGIGLLGLFRHKSSCGGIGILAIYIQEKTGLKAGWFQLAFDLVLFSSSLFFLKPQLVLYSLIGAAVLNFLVAWNHRKEWYVAK